MQSSAQHLATVLVKAIPARQPPPLRGITGEVVEELNANNREASVTYDKPPLLHAQQHHHSKTKYATGLW